MRVNVSCGVSVGSILAAIISWTLNKSVIWALVHIFFSWLYVFYAACVHNSELEQAIEHVERRAR